MPLKLFRATVANADNESRKSLHTFLKNKTNKKKKTKTKTKNKTKQNKTKQNKTNKKQKKQKQKTKKKTKKKQKQKIVVFKLFWQSADAILDDVPVPETNV